MLVIEQQVDKERVRSRRNDVGDAAGVCRRQRRAEGRDLGGQHGELAMGITQILIVNGELEVVVIVVADAGNGMPQVKRVRAADACVRLEGLIRGEKRKRRISQAYVPEKVVPSLAGAVSTKKR